MKKFIVSVRRFCRIAKRVFVNIATTIFGLDVLFGVAIACAFDPDNMKEWLSVMSVIVGVACVLWYWCGVKEEYDKIVD